MTRGRQVKFCFFNYHEHPGGNLMNVTQFKKQHDELLALTGEISKYLEIGKLTHNVEDVKKLFIKLLGQLTVHLKLEDEWLYPKLLEHQDEKIKAMAQRFVDEMGGIGQTVADYKQKWIIATSAIKQDPAGFIKETKEVFSALAHRIEIENNVLYKSFES